MYNPALDTFVRAAELGSFSKVALESYISPSAVIQQINHLEAELNVRLFARSKKGVTLTPAGEYFLLESKALIQRCCDIRSHLLVYSDHAAGSVLFGTNEFHAPRLIYDYWPGFAAGNSSSTLSSYSFSQSGSDIRPDTDLIEGVFFSEPIWQKGFVFHQVSQVKLALLVPDHSSISKHSIITDVDLKGHTVLTIKRGISEPSDRMCDDLKKAGIATEEVEIYSTSVLIDCMESDKPVIIPDCWSGIHPHSKTVSFIREYECPYGFFLSKTASNAAKMFMRYVEQ